MTDSIVPNFVRFDSNDLELVVDTTTGKAYASISATARMMEVEPIQIKRELEKWGYEYTSPVDGIPTAGGFQGGTKLVDSESIFDLAFKFYPQLAKRMGSAGANVYMLGLAGYKVQVEQPNLPTDELGWMELAVAKKKEALSLAAQIEAYLVKRHLEYRRILATRDRLEMAIASAII